MSVGPRCIRVGPTDVAYPYSPPNDSDAEPNNLPYASRPQLRNTKNPSAYFSSASESFESLAMFAFKYCKPNLHSPSCLKTPKPGAMNSLMQQATGNKPNGTLWPFPASQISSRMSNSATKKVRRERRKLGVTGCHGEETNSEKRSFLSLEEAGLVEIFGLSTHERFFC